MVSHAYHQPLKEGKKTKEERLKGKYGITLEINKDNSADLSFVQEMEFVPPETAQSIEKEPTHFKTLTLLQCEFSAADEAIVKH